MTDGQVTESTMLEPGCYIDSHWGHYQSQRIIEMAMDLGWPDPAPKETANLLSQYPDLDLDDNPNAADIWYDIVDEAEEYINDRHVPEGYWFGHHPDMGDVGVYPIEDEE